MDLSLNQLNIRLTHADFMTDEYRKHFVNDFRRYLLGAGYSYEEMNDLKYRERSELWKIFNEESKPE